MNDPAEDSYGVMGTPSGPEAVRAVQEVLLVDGLQYLADGVFFFASDASE